MISSPRSNVCHVARCFMQLMYNETSTTCTNFKCKDMWQMATTLDSTWDLCLPLWCICLMSKIVEMMNKELISFLNWSLLDSCETTRRHVIYNI